MQSIPFFGKRGSRRDAAAAEADAAGARVDAAWIDIAAKIKVAYAQYAQAARTEVLTSEIIGILTRLEAIAQARYAGGLVPQQDVLRAQVERTTMESEVIALASEKRRLRARINALLARPADTPLPEPRGFAPLPSDQALDRLALEQRIRDGNPLLAADRARVRAAEKNVDVAYRNRYPDFTVGVSPIQRRNRVNEWELMIEVSIPLQQSTRRAQESEAGAMLAAARARQRATENQLMQELAENLAGLDAARRMERLSSAALQPQAELTLRSASASYETGRLEFATLLDAQRQIRKARQDAVKAAAEARMRIVEIERLVGGEL
jgi:outer membrane protein TolC